MIREATHQKIQYKGYWLDKGQLLTTQQELINKLQWLKGYTPMYYTKAQMKTAMKTLRDLGLIDTKNALHGTIITICNYDYYQRISNYEKTSENSNETPTNTPSKNNQDAYHINKNIKNNKKIKKKYMIDIKNFKNLNNNSKIAYKFWELFRNRAKELDLSIKSIESAELEVWTNPIKELTYKHNKTFNEFQEVYQFLSQNEFWKGIIKNTKKLLEKDKNGNIYFDTLLLQKREEDEKNRLPTTKEIKIILADYFKEPTDYFIKLLLNYLEQFKKINSLPLNNKTFYIEINKLADYSRSSSMVAVNILKKALNTKQNISKMN